MNATAFYTAEHPGSRRCSTETILSIQGRETDFVQDTSDTEQCASDDSRVEYEPVTESEDEHITDHSSGESDNEIITTKVIEVSVRSDGELQLADTEQSNSESDSEIDLHDYWNCAQCRATNNNPLYRYCEKCYKVRKNIFPPRPKRKRKRDTRIEPESVPRTLSQDSGVESINSQESVGQDPQDPESTSAQNEHFTRPLKRRAESADRDTKRSRLTDSDSDASEKSDVKPLIKTVSDPSLTIDDVKDVKLTKKVIVNTIKESLENKDELCIICFSEPKSGVFVHGRIAHICCCYKCAVKVWAKAKRCPVCNCKVSNVLRAVVM